MAFCSWIRLTFCFTGMHFGNLLQTGALFTAVHYLLNANLCILPFYQTLTVCLKTADHSRSLYSCLKKTTDHFGRLQITVYSLKKPYINGVYIHYFKVIFSSLYAWSAVICGDLLWCAMICSFQAAPPPPKRGNVFSHICQCVCLSVCLSVML